MSLLCQQKLFAKGLVNIKDGPEVQHTYHKMNTASVSPPNENLIISNPYRPWYERYQPISYKLCTRSGNEEQFRDMVTRCNNVGVNIYVDAVINHMCGSGGGSGTQSTCGSSYNTGTKDFPAVPYSYLDFNDGKSGTGSGEIENYGDANQVRNCRLVGLLDLALEKDYVRDKIADYLNNLISIGVAGFRLDAAKHMWSGDIKAITSQLNNLNTQWFVIDLGGEAISASEYFGNGRITEFKYDAKLGNVIRKWNGERMAYLRNWGEGWGFMPSDRGLVFIDNHDTMVLYKMGVGFMLAHPYGQTCVMSSYYWTRNFINGKDVNDWIGPPSYSNGSTKAVTINADSTCGNDWVCEHRWRQIKNMVIFRNVVNGQALANWWDNGGNRIAFSRGKKGFIIFNNDNMDVTLSTGLPAGTYCDVISGQKEGIRCTGTQITVSNTGSARFLISSSAKDPFIAIHVNAKL
uniref:Alpha-amylase n=1 Tax=Leptobrachium leishanense TaxID=445787 RepID=A0A8C5Q3L3_9ANUR